MRLIKLHFIIYLFIFAASTNAQTVKPKFKELTMAVYQPNDSTKTLGVTLLLYFNINSDGVMHYIFNAFNLSTYNCTGITRDTTYQLSDKVITGLNTIFNGEKTLKSYVAIKQLPHGVMISEPGNFVTYTMNNGKKDNLIFSEDFFGPDVNDVLNNIYFARPARTTHAGKIYHNKTLEAEIIKDHKACNCIPKTEAPPTVKELPGH